MEEPKTLVKRIALGKGKNHSVETVPGSSETIPTSRSATTEELRLLLMAIQWWKMAKEVLD